MQVYKTLTAGAALVASGALVALAVPGAASASAPSHIARPGHSATVVSNGTSVSTSHRTILAGHDRFLVASTNPVVNGDGGSNVTLFRLNHGVSVSQFNADIREEFSQTPAVAAKGTRDLVRDITAYGLADVVPGHPEIVTENLRAGQYYLTDLVKFTGTGSPALTSLRVIGQDRPGVLFGRTLIEPTSADRFGVSSTYWPHNSAYLFKNVADTIHFMSITPAKAGTTDAQVQAYFDSHVQTPPPFAVNGPSGGNDVVSPGHTIQVNYNLPRGTYVLLCFVADDMTGMPHAFMGMHKVIHLT